MGKNNDTMITFNPFANISLPELAAFIDVTIENPDALSLDLWKYLLPTASSAGSAIGSDKIYRLNQVAVTVEENPERHSSLEAVLEEAGKREDKDVFVPHYLIAVNERSMGYLLGLGLPDTMHIYAIANITSVNNDTDIDALVGHVVSHTKSKKNQWQSIGVNFFNGVDMGSPEHVIALGRAYTTLQGFIEDHPDLRLDLLRVANSALEYSTSDVNPVIYRALVELRSNIPELDQLAFAKRLAGSYLASEILDPLNPTVKVDVLTGRFLETAERTLEDNLAIGRTAISLLDQVDVYKELSQVASEAYKNVIKDGISQESNVIETYKAELKDHSTEFPLESQQFLGRELVNFLALDETLSFLNTTGKIATLQEMSTKEVAYDNGVGLFNRLVGLIKGNPLIDESQENAYLINLGKKLSEREESLAYQNRLALFNGFYEVAMALRPHSQETGKKGDQSYANQAIDLGLKLLEIEEGTEDVEFLSRMFEISRAYASDSQLITAVDKTGITDLNIFSVVWGKLSGREEALGRLISNFENYVLQEMELAKNDRDRKRELYMAGVDANISTGNFHRALTFAQQHAYTRTKPNSIDVRVDYTGYVIGQTIDSARKRETKDLPLEATAYLWRGRPEDITKATRIVNRLAGQIISGQEDVYQGVMDAERLVVSFKLQKDQVPIIGQTIQEQMQKAGTTRLPNGRVDYDNALRWAQLGQFPDMIQTYQLLAQSFKK